jgi:hypothetical protein
VAAAGLELATSVAAPAGAAIYDPPMPGRRGQVLLAPGMDPAEQRLAIWIALGFHRRGFRGARDEARWLAERDTARALALAELLPVALITAAVLQGLTVVAAAVALEVPERALLERLAMVVEPVAVPAEAAEAV